MNISEAARKSGLSAKMIRYYEAIGLFPPMARSEAGYRRYTDQDLQTLLFVKQARSLGFSMAHISELMRLWRDGNRASSAVKQLAEAHIADLDAKATALVAMSRALKALVDSCPGDDGSACPIVDGLADERMASTSIPARTNSQRLRP